ncbi:nuclease SbcCD subunit D [Psychromonas marina]|uniref:Nuclease SbcCD subunit D n=2 Tax=Psychromonas marina TaxID=88364 RepID=A0ABQ6DXI6_9GAMM|nr:nuclease SbcCD subunit D [Psychromonas marina]
MMKNREPEHRAFLAWLIEQVVTLSIDAVVVAGDIFDSASPASYARKLYSDFIVNLQKAGCTQLIIVSGNHDSVAVLNESKSLLSALNVSVLAGLSDDLSEHLITIKDKQDNEAIICALPFLRATDVMLSESGSSADQKQMSLQQGIAKTYQDIYTLAESSKKHQHCPIIATGHLTAVGCSVSESVRDIYIGTLTAFPAQLFPEFDYIALGHLHRAQKVQKSEHIRYSGSPIALSFDEVKHDKRIIIAEFNESAELTTSEVVIPAFQKLAVITGNLASVIIQINRLIETGESVWVEVKIQESFYRSDVQVQLNDLVAATEVQILKVSTPKIDENSQLHGLQIETLDELKPADLFQKRLDCADAEYISEEQQVQLKTLFAQSIEELEQKS